MDVASNSFLARYKFACLVTLHLSSLGPRAQVPFEHLFLHIAASALVMPKSVSVSGMV